MTELELAEQIACAAHAGQIEESTGDPYIRHLERVVALVDGDDAKAVAWLHDVLEDTTTDQSHLFAAGIPQRIAAAVLTLSRFPWENYAEYIGRVKETGDELALAVKIADLRDHLRPNCPERLRPRYEKAWVVLTKGQPLPV